MTNNLINVFASEEYLLLFWLSKNLTKSKQKTSVRFSQAEIAEELGVSEDVAVEAVVASPNVIELSLAGTKTATVSRHLRGHPQLR